jgi:hypothetical protein
MERSGDAAPLGRFLVVQRDQTLEFVRVFTANGPDLIEQRRNAVVADLLGGMLRTD